MTFALEIITPDRVVLRQDADFIQVRGKHGELGILPGHTPFFTALASDLLLVKSAGAEQIVAVMGGFLDVAPTKVTILAPAAELAAEIDELRARTAEERARLQLDREKTAELETALARSLVRLRALDLVGRRGSRVR
ncbi:MAG: ATP synthase F1 subunit epsilon [Cyanobacteria bacterium NC_groundwater_1444_Ag_S-0.65um_54_12]|nr:ATP synthase F1 subunit epsilon [Cyanobacteria bacterium NC_groundwater_1444_Ag_S-0.65um_54_12]